MSRVINPEKDFEMSILTQWASLVAEVVLAQ